MAWSDLGVALSKATVKFALKVARPEAPRVSPDRPFPEHPGFTKPEPSPGTVAPLTSGTVESGSNTRAAVPAPSSATPKTCLPCSVDHLATVCGSLGESLRFARRTGMADIEVQKRIALAEEEINMMERLDLNAINISQLPEKEKTLARWVLGESKPIRDRLKTITSLNDLEALSADACRLRLEFKVKQMNLPPAIMDVTRDLEQGKVTPAQAQEKITTLIKANKGETPEPRTV